MHALFDIIRANPWPFGAGLLAVLVMIIADNSSRDKPGDSYCGDLWDADGADGCGGD
jgi:hypothetical protein